MTKKIIPIAVATEPAVTSGVFVFEAKNKIYVRAVTGWFAAWRWVLVWLTQAVFYGLP
jgi:hypothetical protein